ncbi:MAG: D-tyrosyl-tRNA(Tyr) deacylase [Thioalkalivibrio sp.]|jgi:D-tyrosyl-tRNA(Tyr) deacylase|nr:D-tyrosyl-tRNA(Tyr) deacylase [Thioalkalivibrio sp.]
MIALIQRVSEGQVRVDAATIGTIGPGLVALVAVEPEDTRATAERMLDRLLGYRVFADAEGRMNLSLAQTDGGLLLVPQFTLTADTRKGMRPSFAGAASPAHGATLFDYLATRAAERHTPVARGQFGAEMQVSLTNEGPVTFWLTAR